MQRCFQGNAHNWLLVFSWQRMLPPARHPVENSRRLAAATPSRKMSAMRIGIDFGTTRVVVAAADRGNYPLVNFEAPDGRVRDWFPSLLAVSGDKRVYGWEALEQQGKPGWTVVRSLKRWLKNAGPCSAVDVAGQRLNVSLLMSEMMMALRRELME